LRGLVSYGDVLRQQQLHLCDNILCYNLAVNHTDGRALTMSVIPSIQAYSSALAPFSLL
jgi:hypothetical protein